MFAVADRFTAMNAQASTGAGLVADVSGFAPGASSGPVMQIIITNTATVQIQQAIDATNWVTVATITATDAYVLLSQGLYYRPNVSAYTSGTVTVIVGPGVTPSGLLGAVRGPLQKSGGPA